MDLTSIAVTIAVILFCVLFYEIANHLDLYCDEETISSHQIDEGTQ